MFTAAWAEGKIEMVDAVGTCVVRLFVSPYTLFLALVN